MVLNERYKGDAFRLAAVLYADNNYEVSPKTILRKIIESLFLTNDNIFLSIDSIIEQIEQKYDFIFSEEEIERTVKAHKSTHFLIALANDEKLICLENDRLNTLKSKVNHKNIDYFINEFLSLTKTNFGNKNKCKETIYRFLYEGFNSNVTSFSRFLDVDFDVKNFISNLNHNFNENEATLINEFLKWDNDSKNKSIFDISSFALEYCLITNKKSNNTFEIGNLKNKSFYLDTNVIFRAIGINGDSRKKRALTFFDKLKEVEERLVLTKYTDQEFKNTINYYVSEIGKNLSPRINSKVFLQYSTQPDFYNYYFRWKENRQNDNLELFRSFILASYEELKTKYGIVELNNPSFNENDEAYIKKIDDLVEEIYQSKRSWASNPDFVVYESISYDAKNIFLVENERGNKCGDIFQAKHFFISTDQLLKKWDLDRDDKTPSVILPSHWLTILLRYYSRTNDDFKSFVSFLSLSQNGSTISNKNLTKVLNGISEITLDMNEQSKIVNELIKNKFEDIISEDTSSEEIVDNAKKYTQSVLEQKIDKLQDETKNLKGIVEGTKNEIESFKTNAGINLNKNNELTEKLIKEKYKGLRRKGYLCFLVVLITILLILLIFFFKEKDWNFIQIYVTWANSLEKSSIEKTLASKLAWAIPSFVIAYFGRLGYKIFWSKKYIKEEKAKIKDEIENK
jgi:hypothetical protein